MRGGVQGEAEGTAGANAPSGEKRQNQSVRRSEARRSGSQGGGRSLEEACGPTGKCAVFFPKAGRSRWSVWVVLFSFGFWFWGGMVRTASQGEM